MITPEGPEQGRATPESEVLISGMDTGPSYDERQNRTPTDKLIGLTPPRPNEPEPEDEDG